MAEYINEEPCEFIYNITAVEKIVDGDTIDAVLIWVSMYGYVIELDY